MDIIDSGIARNTLGGNGKGKEGHNDSRLPGRLRIVESTMNTCTMEDQWLNISLPYKEGYIKYISHLDMMLLRAFKTGLHLNIRKANPSPRLSLAQPSLGYEGKAEMAEFETKEDVPPEEILKSSMNRCRRELLLPLPD